MNNALSVKFSRIILTRSIKGFTFRRDKIPLHYRSLNKMGLYVHIPFCRQLCDFCPYCRTRYDQDEADRYIEALLREIDLVGDQPAVPVTSLYFGGGTPALLLPQLGRVIDRLRHHFVINDGIAIELHPDDVTPQNIKIMKTIGISMVSVGVQSFDPSSLDRLGRSPEDSSAKIKMLREAGFATIDVDLIFGLPDQTAAVLRSDVETALAAGATQISTYPFINFSFADNEFRPSSPKNKKKLLDELNRLCPELGLVRTAVWTFARPGTSRYSSVTRDNFLGFGVSATTLLLDQFKINTFSIQEYCHAVAEGHLPTALTLSFTPRQRAVYHLFWASYGLSIRKSQFKAITGSSPKDLFRWEIKIAELSGLITRRSDGDGWDLTSYGARLYHSFEQHFTLAYIDRTWKVCRREAWPSKIILR